MRRVLINVVQILKGFYFLECFVMFSLRAGTSLITNGREVGWYVYHHTAGVKVTAFDKASYVPFIFLEPSGTNRIARTFTEFVPKQMNFLSKSEEPCSDDPGYIYEKASLHKYYCELITLVYSC